MKTLLAIAAGLALTAAAQAQSISLTASLTGANERPTANNSTATGIGSVTIAGDLLTYSVSYSGVNPTAAHFHGPAGVDQSAGVLIPLTLSSSSGNTGIFSGTATLTDTQKTTILGGNSYLNIHSAAFPGGEIRGQVVAVPEPGTVALLALGGAAIALRARRKS